MKLILCPYCHDLFRLFHQTRLCECGRVGGRYLNNIDAVVTKDAISIAIGNGSLQSAISAWKSAGNLMGRHFYQRYTKVEYCWVRPNSGAGNPHTKVVDSIQDLDEPEE